ncbi:hypothetical protein [Ochrobactrum sp. BTU2]|uniref:hypothetical protein n=1 Tax=Ochrobactrum sp. BTU2 TaxID=2856166 RepID=UPI00211A8755|nr:hypothetical protein [Ochrobactrum sp. BTU2]MCQ9146180.1 hypothetical protein [Ochrobactrum sp. BTU2]
MTAPYEYKRIPLYLVDVPEGRIRRQRGERTRLFSPRPMTGARFISMSINLHSRRAFA